MISSISRGVLASFLITLLAACGDGDTPQGEPDGAKRVKVDGSSTVFPITEAVAEEFQKKYRGQYQVTVGISGTGGGFKKFCRGETHISDASRPITAGERENCAAEGIDYIELPVALDALSVVVNPKNDWVSCMSVDELRTAWAPEAQNTITNWSQVRDSFPDRPLALYGAGTDSGTYDYFTKAVVGEEHSSRGDFTASEDDNVLVQGVSSDINALGFFGLAYYEENHDKLKAVAIRNPQDECVKPSLETAANGTYVPLTRPLFVYVNAAALDSSKAVREFINFYLDKQLAPTLVSEVGYVPLPPRAYDLAQRNVEERHTGTAFADGSRVGVSIEDLLRAEKAD